MKIALVLALLSPVALFFSLFTLSGTGLNHLLWTLGGALWGAAMFRVVYMRLLSRR